MDWGAFIAGGGAGAVGFRLVETYIKHRLDISKGKHDQKIRAEDDDRQRSQFRAEEERQAALEKKKELDHEAELYGDQMVDFANLKAAIEREVNPINLIFAFRDLERFFQSYPKYFLCRKENKEFFVRFTDDIVTRKLSTSPGASNNPRRVVAEQGEFAADLKLAVEDLQLPTLDEIKASKAATGAYPTSLVASPDSN